MSGLVISRRSWHYRWISFWGYGTPRSLCEYFWTFMAACFFGIISTLLVSVVIFSIPVELWSWLHNGSSKAKEMFLLETGVLGILVGFGLIAILWNQLREWLNQLKHQPPSKSLSAIQVVVKSAAAFKEKICPLIRYE